MEEADLLKERLQAITDKRRIQEAIAKKKRQIEEEKLKLQYIKKKALREQWLMDGLSRQSEDEQEALRLQAQDEQQQSDQLQSNILRIEEEIEALETEELNISANEEVILKRLKEVERTAEDIIKDANSEFQAGVKCHVPLTLPDIALFIPHARAKARRVQEPGSETRKATFAMEISVEHNKKTGENLVLSKTTISPATIQERGLKVYDDGHKSVYALQPDGAKVNAEVVGEMTHTEVEELLDQASDEKIPTEVQYHQPVYSVPYIGSSTPSRPSTPSKTPRQSAVPCRNGDPLLKEESQCVQKPLKQSSPKMIHEDFASGKQKADEEAKLLCLSVPEQSKNDKNPVPWSHVDGGSQHRLTESNRDSVGVNGEAVSVKVRSEGAPEPTQPMYKPLDSPYLSLPNHDSEVDRRASVNLINALPEVQESEPITMIFMGYEKAADEEEDNIQAEIVVLGNCDDENDQEKTVKDRYEGEESLSYHPEGYKSKIFKPKMGIAVVAGCQHNTEDTCADWDDLELHKPTFIHKQEKRKS